MELLVPIALYGWLPVVFFIFNGFRGHRGIAAAYVIAWLFLPSTGIPFSGLPDYTKVTATTIGTLLAIMVLEPRRIFAFRFHWVDLFMVVFCLCPLASAISNGLGLWDGGSNVLNLILPWGLPYLFGRLYFDSFDKLTDLAKAIFLGGLVYIPFCLIEVRMSPQFYNWTYGPRMNTLHSYRYGGWRPVVFLETGLELGMWMTAASLIGIALWYSGAIRRINGVPLRYLLGALLLTTLLCKSTGALMLLIFGAGVLIAARMIRHPWPLYVAVMIPLCYVTVRTANLNDGSQVVQLSKAAFGAERAHSLDFRFQNETLLVQRALEAPLFGWGGWNREKVLDEYGEDTTIVDGLWVIHFGKYGMVSLLSLLGAFLIAPTIACKRFTRSSWRYAEVAPTLAIALLLLLYMIDCLLNAMVNPIYSLCLGAIATLAFAPTRLLVNEPAEDDEYDAAPAVVAARLWPPRPALWPVPVSDVALSAANDSTEWLESQTNEDEDQRWEGRDGRQRYLPSTGGAMR
ncbi:MAG: hypothetical protein KDA92_02050 [Planctomycetales bacterium]|nr:hypothetical protein [Planctomycetales bacterium]MCA9166615.1 hypothetical protein [Planctomycetales bacterium]